MTQTDTRSLQQIKRETEQTRAGLTNTVEQLRTSVADTAADIRHRISPDAIKAEVSGYIKSRGEQLLNDVTDAARKNPMQAVAVGASLAYPLLRMARSVPLPVLMVGAGLFFAGSKTGQSMTQKASDVASDLSEEGMRRAHDLVGQVGDSAAAAKEYASEQFDRLSGAVSGGSNQIGRAAGDVNRAAGEAGSTIAAGSRRFQDQAASLGGALAGRTADLKQQSTRFAGAAAEAVQDKAAAIGNTLRERAGDLRDQGMRMAGSAASTVQGMAADATTAMHKAVDAGTDAGLEAAGAVRDRATDFADRASKTISQTIEENPLLVAGVGLLIGGLIASALPRSDIEDSTIGEASTAAKRRAQAAASQGFEAAKDAVGEVYDQVTQAAETEGLTPNGLGKAAQDIGQRVRRVAESAVTAAFDPEQANGKSNGGNDHV